MQACRLLSAGPNADMPAPEKKPLMRSLGEFVGHIVKGVRTNPAKKTIRKEVQEQRREDGVILRRTTIEEVEIRKGDSGRRA